RSCFCSNCGASDGAGHLITILSAQAKAIIPGHRERNCRGTQALWNAVMVSVLLRRKFVASCRRATTWASWLREDDRMLIESAASSVADRQQTPEHAHPTIRRYGRHGMRLRELYRQVRDATETLAAPLSAEDQTIQSMPDASPAKWHRAHTTWFFETFLLRVHDRAYRPYDEQFFYLFNSYYEAIGPRHARPSRGLITRPGIAEVAAYRAHV